MRQKDSLVSENAVLTKLAERQQHKVETANEMQHNLSEQLVSLSCARRNVIFGWH